MSEAWPTWRPRTIARVGGAVLVALGVLLAVALTASPPSAGYLPAVVIWVVVLVFSVGVWRSAYRAYVACTREGLRVRNAWEEFFVPWAEIASVKPTYWGLWIIKHDGKIVTARAVQKSNAATWLKRRTRADEVAEAIRERIPPGPFDTGPYVP